MKSRFHSSQRPKIIWLETPVDAQYSWASVLLSILGNDAVLNIQPFQPSRNLSADVLEYKFSSNVTEAVNPKGWDIE